MNKIVYICDCCKKEVKEEELIKVILPYQVVRDTTSSLISWELTDSYKSSKEFEICQQCAKNVVDGYRKYINVSDYPYEGWKIELSGEVE